MPPLETKTVLLDTAERLFAERGFSAVSLRQIIGAAGVNLAAVHYHFGSKEILIQALLARRITPLNQERLARLERAERRAGKRGPSLTQILEAMIEPALRLSRDTRRGGDVFMRLIGRALSDPNEKLQELLLQQFRVVADRFLPAFHRALPRLPLRELYWRLHFTVGAMAHTMTHGQYLRLISGGLCDPDDTDRMASALVGFAARGLETPMRKGRT